MKVSQRFVFFVAAFLLIAGSAFGQGTTGALNGTVTHEGAPLPGVTITISSPALQGTRVAVSNVNGDFNFPALPPGQYTVQFEMEGMATVTNTVRVGLARTERVNAVMQLSAVAEAITVTAAAPAVLETTEVQANFDQDLIEDLPVGRTVQATTNLAPGVNSNGPSGALTISGAPAYDSLYLVNGAVTNENVRGQTDNLFIEDAIQETSVITGSISAEYGRFTGGVVSAITKSGGNEFSGTFRDSFTNASWTDVSDYDEPKAPSEVLETYEATLGGRIVRDRLWFFAAGRKSDTSVNRTYRNSDIAAPTETSSDERLEVKLTGQINPKHSLVGSYLDYTFSQTDYCFIGRCWELSTIDPARAIPREMVTANYNGILTSNFLLEAGYSTRDLVFEDSGGDHRTTDYDDPRDIALGSWGYDAAGYGGFFGAPVFCGPCTPETRENEYYNLKGTYYLATAGTGSHNIVVGYENFTESRIANNYQSGSDFNITVINAPPQRAADGTVLPVITGTADSAFGLGDFIAWWPIFELTKGSDWNTSSFFINDKWDLNANWSFNIGARYDINDGKDSSGNLIADDSYVSPRLGVIYDVKGDGRFRVNASYSKYVARIQETIGGGAGGGGNPSYFYYEYQGPTISGLPTVEAFTQAFDWFLQQGGTNASELLLYAGIPGLNPQIRSSLDSPNVDEITVGFGTQIGQKGFIRMDYIDREWNDFYTSVNAPGDYWEDPFGNMGDVAVYTNTNDFERTYNAVSIQGNYRFTDRLNLGGNYTWSETKGNVVSQTSGSGPVTDNRTYLEYRDFARNNPVGYLDQDQTHKARIWLGYDLPLGMFGNVNFSVLQNYDSGVPYSAVAGVPVRAYVDNPGYLLPPSTLNYYFSDRGEYRWDDATSTDLAINYEVPIFKVSLFVQGELLNAFNEQAQIGGSTSIRVIQAFDPFTETPVEGVNWEKRSSFGQPLSKASYQLARTYRFSVGLRF